MYSRPPRRWRSVSWMMKRVDLAPLVTCRRSTFGTAHLRPSSRRRSASSGGEAVPSRRRCRRGHQAVLALLLVGGAEDDDEDRDAADGGGEAVAHEPAEAAFALRLGVVDRVHVARAARFRAAVQSAARGRRMLGRDGTATPDGGVTAMVDHDLVFPFNSAGPTGSDPSATRQAREISRRVYRDARDCMREFPAQSWRSHGGAAAGLRAATAMRHISRVTRERHNPARCAEVARGLSAVPEHENKIVEFQRLTKISRSS